MSASAVQGGHNKSIRTSHSEILATPMGAAKGFIVEIAAAARNYTELNQSSVQFCRGDVNAPRVSRFGVLRLQASGR